jgi:hypothetical protein
MLWVLGERASRCILTGQVNSKRCDILRGASRHFVSQYGPLPACDVACRLQCWTDCRAALGSLRLQSKLITVGFLAIANAKDLSHASVVVETNPVVADAEAELERVDPLELFYVARSYHCEALNRLLHAAG